MMVVRNTCKGFVLIEALIALIVSAVGLLGIGLFSSYWIKESSNTKAHAEALSIAQNQIEVLHSLAANNFASLSPPSAIWPTVNSPINGANGQFIISSALASRDSTSGEVLDALIQVSWDGQEVSLRTSVVDDIYDSKALVNTGSGSGSGTPFYINPPTGGAKYDQTNAPGGNFNPDFRLEDMSVVSGADGVGVALVYNTASGALPLLTYSGDAFSEIRGVVYVDVSSANMTSDSVSSIVVKPSDTGICPHGSPNQSGSDWFVEYICYFGAGWYGNIDVDTTNFEDHCVGDPAYTNDGTDLSRHAVWLEPSEYRRAYRGYTIARTRIGTDDYYGVDSSGNLLLISHGIGEGDIYGYADASTESNVVIGDPNHDFMIVGTPSNSLDLDDSCIAQMNTVSVASYSGLFPVGITSFESNGGDFICLQVGGSFSCPGTIPSALASTSTVSIYSITGTVSSSYGSVVASSTSQYPSGDIKSCERNSDGSVDISSCTNVDICTNTDNTYSCKVFVPDGVPYSDSITISHNVPDAYEVCNPLGGQEVFSNIISNISGSELSVVIGTCPSIDYSGQYDVVLLNNTGSSGFNNKALDYQENDSVSCTKKVGSEIQDGGTVTITDACAVSSGSLNIGDTIVVGTGENARNAVVTAVVVPDSENSGTINATIN
ncbi:hypothetical protein [Marinobacterium sp. xm-g-59]|uniref:type IV pilus modification PilV family protein n=1 Tax=Marinobacterium sp. xm-g-59 TaxID=2497748 RepID=UPI0015688162|nr:hypothetical protein [Marinobacterium sp. xm-g-59]